MMRFNGAILIPPAEFTALTKENPQLTVQDALAAYGVTEFDEPNVHHMAMPEGILILFDEKEYSIDSIQKDVTEMMEMMNQITEYTDEVKQLRYDLIHEEVVNELLPALQKDDLVNIADGIADSIVVLIGTSIALGVDMGPIWEAVHNSNMAKKDGPIAPNGKRLKPKNWMPPAIKELLEAQGFGIILNKEGDSVETASE